MSPPQRAPDVGSVGAQAGVTARDEAPLDLIAEPIRGSDVDDRGHWTVLIVDDDADVHDATQLALRGVSILDRRLQFISARSAAEARRVLAAAGEIAVVLLDVVMETPDSGLKLVDHIRRELGRRDTRIILRTGQPGYAPELAAIRDYDINDYKTKSELTRIRLVTTLTAAIRSYEQIRTIEAGRRGLDRIARAMPEMLAAGDLPAFTQALISQLAALAGGNDDGVVGAQADDAGLALTRVLAAGGSYAALAGRAVEGLPVDPVLTALQRALETSATVVDAQAVAICVGGHADLRLAAAVPLAPGARALSPRLVEVFASNVAVCLHNVRLLEQLRAYAYVDPLVNLPNRLGLLDALDRRLAAGERDRLTLALLDIDRFAEINNAFGHLFGDVLLKALAEQLRHKLDPDCVVARVSDDMFAVLGVQAHVEPTQLRRAIDGGVMVGPQRQPLSVTIGLLRLADGSGRGADLLKDANIALMHAKQQARGREGWYSASMGTEIRERVRLLDELRDAIDRERLFIVYQPQIDLASGRAIGAEALLRWRSDEGRLIPPDRFIPLAEQSGLIIGLGGWVLRQACRFQRRLAAAGHAGFRIAVNLSVAQFRDPRLLERTGDAIRDSGIDPRDLELEITESVAMTGERRMLETFSMLRTLGVQIAIDDFGTGYSSLAYLQRMPVDRLKIDRSFTLELGSDGSGSIADTVLQLGRALKLSVVAEGVEDAQQAAVLRRLGCSIAQGFHFARPMLADDLVTWLAAQRRTIGG